MSTSCHLQFTRGDTSLLTYTHYDGYPSRIIPLLRAFWRWYPRTDDLEYLCATWFYYCKRLKEMRRNTASDVPVETDRLEYSDWIGLSHRICADGEVQNDATHLYQVDVDDNVVYHHTPEGTGFDTQSPSDIVGREPENIFPLSLGDIDRPLYQSAQNASARADGGQTITVGVWSGCDWCASPDDLCWIVERGTPAGNYLGLVGDDTAELCDDCMEKVADRL